METIINKLLDAFENRQMTRRQLVSNLVVATAAIHASSSPEPLLAQERGATEGFRTAGLDHISFSVSDYGRSRDFYSELMGWTVVDDNGERQATLRIGDVGDIIIRNSRQPFSGSPTAVIDHVAWRIEDFDTDRVREELDRRGVNGGRDQGLGPGVPVDPDSEVGQEGYDSYMASDPDGWVLQISK